MDFETPVSLIFSCFVLGSGYLTLYLLNSKEEYMQIKNYDKLMQSVIIGGLAFVFSFKISEVKINLGSSEEVINSLTNSPIIFIVMLIISMGLYLLLKFLKKALEPNQ